LIGASFSPDNITAWMNVEFIHALPLALNTINRAILKASCADCDIVLTNQPYERKKDSEDYYQNMMNHDTVLTMFALFFCLLAYWPAVFIGFYIKERECRAKLLQFISGANRILYWTTSFAFDYTILFLVICILIGKLGFYQLSLFSSVSELARFVLIFNSYGFAMLPLVYLLSYLFSKPTTGESLIPVFCITCKLIDF